MATTFETGSQEIDDDLIDLEPTLELTAAGLSSDDGPRPSAGVGLQEGSVASLAGETNSLRHDRLRSAAIFLAIAYGVLFVWILGTAETDLAGISLVLMAARAIIATGIAVYLWTQASLDPSRVRLTEYILFGGMTLFVVIAQYMINLELLRQGDITGAISYIKNGVIQIFVLMFLYGTFIPNKPRATARVVLTMALGPVIALTLLMEHEGITDVIEQIQLRSHEQAGSNVLILLIGAALAIYSSYTLNNLRAEIHEAKKFGQYQLREKIGAGGMGEVYLAEHQLLKRPCAIKLIRPEALANPVARARFEREVQSSARLSHPNTIEIFDYGHTDDGTFYYVMEYLKGMSLADLVNETGPLPPGRTIYLIRQVCAGLAEAHALGLVHRDLKPANVFVAIRGGEADVAKVLDFGLVKLTKGPDSAELTSELTVSGTPLYMAPEQAQADIGLDARADIYALGAILYYCLTGQPPFNGNSAFAVMMAHARDPVTPPSQILASIPSDLEAVVMKCLAKPPEDRYQEVRSLSKALAACQAANDWSEEKAEAWWDEENASTSVKA